MKRTIKKIGWRFYWIWMAIIGQIPAGWRYEDTERERDNEIHTME